MNCLEFRNIHAVFLVIAHLFIMQSCSVDVGGSEDKAAPVVAITGIGDADESDGEIIGEATLTWTTTDPNPSTVAIYLSSDSGETFDTDAAITSEAPDNGVYTWDTNKVSDCRACRIRIVATDVVGNVGEPADMAEDFVINNVPQVLGSAIYYDFNNDGVGDGDAISVPFDKNIEVASSIASFVFALPVIGDSFGPFSTLSYGANDNELIINISDINDPNPHLHVAGQFDRSVKGLTAPSGLDISSDFIASAIIARDTGRSAESVGDGIDFAPGVVAAVETYGSSNTRGIALADLNGDGFLDMVTGNDSTQPDKVLLNDGDVTFTETGSLSNNDVRALAVGDIDNDGDIDFITASANGTHEVFKNNGSGSMSLFTTAIGSAARSIALGDFDNNDFLDIVVGDEVMMNSGSGAYPAVSQTLGGSIVEAAEVIDADNDGDMDLVLANLSGGNALWLNNGSGVFSKSELDLGVSSSGVTSGDYDKDGDIDLIIGGYLWTNTGAGNFDRSQFLKSKLASLVSVDLDADGDLDIAGIDQGALGGKIIFLNTATSGFVDSTIQFTNEGDTKAIAVGDVDNDGDVDIVSGNGSLSPNRVWTNSLHFSGQQYFVKRDELGSEGTSSVALGDIDNDGDLDLVSGNDMSDNHAWINDGTGRFDNSGQALGLGADAKVAIGDLNNDGFLDVAIGYSDLQPDEIWINNGSGMLVNTGQLLGAFDTQDVKLADVDDDQDLDMITSSRIWLNNFNGSGLGVFTDSGVTIGGFSTKSIAVGDVDGDGDVDIITGVRGGANVFYKNDGDGNFTNSQNIGSSGTQTIALGDLDNDGDLDIVEGNNQGFLPGESSRIWLNNGSGFFVQGQPLDPSVTISIVLADLDEDGDLDIIEANGAGQSTKVWTNTGKAYFVDTNQAFSINGDDLAVGDLDGDGDIDLVIARGLGSPNEIWLDDF